MTYQTRLRPWCIVRPLPEMKNVIIERFRHYQDAHAHLKILRQLKPNTAFEVLFNPSADLPLDSAH